MFDHEGPTVVSAMHNLIVGVFEHLKTTSPMDVDQRLAYTQRILRRAAPKKYKEVLVAKKNSREMSGTSAKSQGYPRRLYGLGTIRITQGMTDMRKSL